MKFKIKDEDLVTRGLEEAVRRLPIEMRLAGMSPEERLRGLSLEERLLGLSPEERLICLNLEEWLKGLKTEELKKLKAILDNLNLN